LWHANFLENNSGALLDHLDQHFLFCSVESDALSSAACSGSSTTSMDVGFCVFRGLDLHNKVNGGDVKATGCHIGRHQNAELFFFEALECYLTLVLCDITVHDFNVFFDFLREQQVVCLFFCRSKHNDLAATVAD